MRLKKRDIPNSRREMNVQEGDGVKKRDMTCMARTHRGMDRLITIVHPHFVGP